MVSSRARDRRTRWFARRVIVFRMLDGSGKARAGSRDRHRREIREIVSRLGLKPRAGADACAQRPVGVPRGIDHITRANFEIKSAVAAAHAGPQVHRRAPHAATDPIDGDVHNAPIEEPVGDGVERRLANSD